MNILLPIDSSDASRKAVHFVGEIFGERAADGLSVTLMHVIESLPDFIVSRTSGPGSEIAFRQVAEEWSATARSEGERLLSGRKQELLTAGLPADAVDTKLVMKEALPEAKKVVAALAIIEEMNNGPYSVVCLGRRGTSAAAGAFPGSVAEKVLREARGRTVWVVD